MSCHVDGLYKAILDLPSSALDDDKLAIIVPAFEIHATSCSTFEECTNQYLYSSCEEQNLTAVSGHKEEFGEVHPHPEVQYF